MEKITATFLFLTLIGALLAMASASESSTNGTGHVILTSPNTTPVTSNSNKTTPNNFTTPAIRSEAAVLTSANVTTPKSVSEATPKTSPTKGANVTTPKSFSEAKPKTSPTKGANVTTKPKTSPTMKDRPTPGPAKPPTTKIRTTRTTPTINIKHKTEGHSASTTYIIILLIIILCIVGAVGYCFYQNKTRNFSLDRNSKNEDAHIPLSTVEPEVFEASASKDMETFAATETTVTAESAPPAEAVEKKQEEKAPTAPAETTQPEKESSPESQDTVPLVEKPGELTVVDLNDGEQTVSNKTSVETLEETPNENNSNNRAQAHVHGANGNFTEITLDDLP